MYVLGFFTSHFSQFSVFFSLCTSFWSFGLVSVFGHSPPFYVFFCVILCLFGHFVSPFGH